MDLNDEIGILIGLKTEGDYWDYKEQWHENKADLLHDIICMANNLVNRDAYIIIGVSDSKSPEGVKVKGVTETNRKDQQHLIDLLRDKKFSGGVRPVVYVQTLNICDEESQPKEVDVIIIKNTVNTPYFLTEDFADKGRIVKGGYIYTRIGDTNTAKTGMADIDKIEYLWRKRFGIDQSVNEKLLRLLDNPDEWVGEFDNGSVKYHSIYPEFQIHLSDEDDQSMQENSIPANIADHFPDTRFSAHELTITYHTTVLFKEDVFYIDGARYMIPFPESNTINLGDFFDNSQSLTYIFIDLDSIRGKLFKCMAYSENNWYCCKWHITNGSAFLLFDDPLDRQKFEDFARIHLQTLLIEYNGIIDSMKLDGEYIDDELIFSGWSKGNEIKSWHLYEMYKGIQGPSLQQKISWEQQSLKHIR